MTLREIIAALEDHWNAHPHLRDSKVIVNMDGYSFYIERLSDDEQWTLLNLDLVTEVEE